MENQVEYYYGDTLRWAFGFDNPNKAAVLFACAVPLLWWLWRVSWRLKSRWLRLSALVVSAVLLGGTWYCLIMTYSRGGLVAAVAALAWMIGRELWKKRKCAAGWRKSGAVWISALVIAALIGGAVWNGLGSRSAQALGNDASVGNRFELWGSALQMAAENPRGFGAGKSGEQYMLWYQPLDRQQGYRTMVNSYLTFLVERGWTLSIAIFAAFAVFWVWTGPGDGETFCPALRASILAFLVAAIFSTTMEEWRLWIMPGTAAAALAGWAVWKRRTIEVKRLGAPVAILVAGCATLWGAGWLKSGQDPLHREFGRTDAGGGVTAVGPRKPTDRELGCVVDERILGDQYARLLRELALGARVRVVLGKDARAAARVLFTGSAVHGCGTSPENEVLLLAPERIEAAELAALESRPAPLKVILPEIDEDGRVDFWEEIADGPKANHFQITSLPGVGNRVDWAWPQLIEIVKGG